MEDIISFAFIKVSNGKLNATISTTSATKGAAPAKPIRSIVGSSAGVFAMLAAAVGLLILVRKRRTLMKVDFDENLDQLDYL